jgi:hypothetical protein
MIITFNTERKPFDDPRVRKALSLAIDRWGGSASLSKISSLGVPGGMVRPGSEWSASPKEMEQWPGYGRDMAANRAEARRLLKEAGQENLTFTLMDRNIAPYVTAGIFAIDQWRQIGIKVEHQQVELASWYSLQNSGQFDAFVDSFTQFSDDPSNVLYKCASYDRSPVAVHAHRPQTRQAVRRAGAHGRQGQAHRADPPVREAGLRAGLLGAAAVVAAHRGHEREGEGVDHVADAHDLPGPRRRLARRRQVGPGAAGGGQSPPAAALRSLSARSPPIPPSSQPWACSSFQPLRIWSAIASTAPSRSPAATVPGSARARRHGASGGRPAPGR